MLCTINTDASFHPKYKVGAFAFWSVSNNFKIQKSGYFRDTCKSSDEAESKCIINAIKTTLNDNSIITKIIINTDSLNSIHSFKNDRTMINRYDLHHLKKLRGLFNKIINDYKSSLIIEFRHVRAHSYKNDARSYVNEWCDREAKKYLWIKIKSNLKTKYYENKN